MLIDEALKEYGTPRQIEIIDAINSQGGYRKAAEFLGIKHSGISRAIAAVKKKASIHKSVVHRSIKSLTHCVIPDGQVKDGVPIEHWEWIGNYIVDKRPDVVINIGDFWDMPSLSAYDKGKKCFEGRRYKKDIEAGNRAMDLLMTPLVKAKFYPRLVFTYGNHEHRIIRAIENDAILDGTIGLEDLELDRWGWEKIPFLKPIEIDGILYCMQEDHKILTTDLEYVPLKNIKVGDEVIGFDESVENGARKFKTAKVLEHGFDDRELFEVTLNNGKTFKCTSDHQWLGRSYKTTEFKWIRTDQLKIGSTQVIKCFPEWHEETSNDAGYLAGMFDGEGHIAKPNGKQGGIQIGMAQRDNSALARCKKVLDLLGIKWKISGELSGTNSNVHCIRILGSSGEKLALLGRIRATRIIDNFKPEMLGRVQNMDGHGKDSTTIINVKPCGIGRIVKLKTSTGTMIIDGYAHHNCHYFYNPTSGKPYGGTCLTKLKNIGVSFTMGHQQGIDIAMRELANGKTQHGLVAGSCYQHDEEYRGPQANGHWNGIVFKHEVHDGQYDLMQVSIDFLKRKYS